MSRKTYSDPTYDRQKIKANPVWAVAFIISEFINDGAPIGWGRYIPVAQAVLRGDGNGKKPSVASMAGVLIRSENFDLLPRNRADLKSAALSIAKELHKLP